MSRWTAIYDLIDKIASIIGAHDERLTKLEKEVFGDDDKKEDA